ncbi:MAG: hypothetical protein BroJett011_11950 [Chloroflexota bacterium]|nr:MAG: hypothetical protein BroJett011_11950 [Chloroflexota bacterium]
MPEAIITEIQFIGTCPAPECNLSDQDIEQFTEELGSYVKLKVSIPLTLSLSLILLSQTLPAFSQNPVLAVAGTATQTYPGSETTYYLELLNNTDQIVYDGILSATLPAGFTYIPGSTIVLGEGWPLEQREPQVNDQTLTWGPYHLPSAGNKLHNPYGIHTLMNDCRETPALHLEGARELIGNGGYVTQLFYGIDANTSGPDPCAVSFVLEAYTRNLIPILRLQGRSVNGVWQAPDPGPDGDYAPIAQAFARYVAGLPRRNTNPLYIVVWNEPDLWIEWSGQPNAAQYARFFVAVSRAIKGLGDGRIRLVNGALTPGNTAFLGNMLQTPGFKEAFDVWASHCYPYNHPPTYNNHNQTARYGTYAIDCYLQETALIKRYGRTGFRVMLTETGYELGNRTFGFEGFARITESNRASYISGAFANYWQKWPEIITVTPFQLSDTSGHWAKFDWIYPTLPYTRHAQFQTVAALPKPVSQLEPYGFQVIFRAKVAVDLAPGTYTSRLIGSDREGHTVLAASAAPVRVLNSGPFQLTFLPLITAPPRRDGPWYFSTPANTSPGAIVPDTFLQPVGSEQEPIISSAALTESASIRLTGEPHAVALAEDKKLGLVSLADGHLEVIDLATRQSERTLWVGNNPQAVIIPPDNPARVYVIIDDGLIMLDLNSRQPIKIVTGLGHLGDLAWDAVTQQLFVSDAGHEQLLVFGRDLKGPLAQFSLPHQPDQVIVDSTARQVYLSFPAAGQVMAVNADKLLITGVASLTGGPILDMAVDRTRHRLYVLSALTPTYRVLTILDTPGLNPVALVAGAGNFPLRTSTSLAITPSGQLVLSEFNGLWQIGPDDFTVRQISSAPEATPVTALTIESTEGTVLALEPFARLLRLY